MGVFGESVNAIAYVVGDGPDVINVRRSHVFSDGQAWQFSIHRDGALLSTGNDVRTPGGKSARDALVSLGSFLGADAEKYQRLMGRPIPEGEDGYIFGDRVAEWAYHRSDELSLISELGEE